jgi:hypothetical protein
MTVKPGYYILLAVILVVSALGGWLMGSSTTRRDLQAQAIKGGHAAWRVTDEHGNVVFEWAANHNGEKAPVVDKKP